MDGKERNAVGMAYRSAFGPDAKAAQTLDYSASDRGQNCPQHCPPSPLPFERAEPSAATEPLGQPITIRAVADLIGCSVWTVRNRLLPGGLPYFRIGRTGKLLFYRNQIVRWVIHKQRQKGGEIR